jgi:hypothetical protein
VPPGGSEIFFAAALPRTGTLRLTFLHDVLLLNSKFPCALGQRKRPKHALDSAGANLVLLGETRDACWGLNDGEGRLQKRLEGD